MNKSLRKERKMKEKSINRTLWPQNLSRSLVSRNAFATLLAVTPEFEWGVGEKRRVVKVGGVTKRIFEARFA